MYLVVSATEIEMAPFIRAFKEHDPQHRLITGVGPLETAYSLTRRLAESGNEVKGVLNFGIGGAYPIINGSLGANLLDICVADLEIMGDLGICFNDRIEEFNSDNISVPTRFPFDDKLTSQVVELLEHAGIPSRRGAFVTVCGVSGTAERGEMVGTRVGGLCENMEGAAAARVCQAFELPFIELRCISNFVEDRDVSKWRLTDACEKAGRAAAVVARTLL
ncbi:MAG: futalosine hydrolase [Desulfobulbaceae bacterium]|nr:futalosine hydrolase [Desulfobulbaceae bacterium]